MEQPIKKTANMTAYHREYKRKQYQENKESIKEKNKAYYYKYKFNASHDDLLKYDTLLPAVVRLRKELNYLLECKPDIINELVQPYMQIPTV
jgi:hypothetical protein